MSKVQISPQAARSLSALVSDISTIDTRAKCSDRFFRQHFMLLVKTIRDTGVQKELETALLDSPMDAAQPTETRPPDDHPSALKQGRKPRPPIAPGPTDEQAAE